MKILVSILVATTLNAQDFIRDDEIQHVAVMTFGYYSCVGLGTLYQKHDINFLNRWSCFAAVMIVGGAKEYYDYKSGTGVASFSDMSANIFVPAIDISIWSFTTK